MYCIYLYNVTLYPIILFAYLLFVYYIMFLGNITLHDIFTAMPWSNTIDVVTITGETLKSVLEHAVSEYDVNNPDPGGRFLQVSGLILTYDVRKSIGQRLLTAYSGK